MAQRDRHFWLKVLIGAAFGSLWAVATLIIRLTDLGYNLLLAVAAVFSQPPGPNPPRPSTDAGPHLPHDPLSGTAPAGQPMSQPAGRPEPLAPLPATQGAVQQQNLPPPNAAPQLRQKRAWSGSSVLHCGHVFIVSPPVEL